MGVMTAEDIKDTDWLDRFTKVGFQTTEGTAYTLCGVRTSDGERTYQDSNPGFQLRRLE